MDKKTFFILTIITFIGLFLHFYKIDKVPPCINADEAAFAYNSYSILKTGKDEFGTPFPLRFKSFSDYKMPVLVYLNVPFIFFFGLDTLSIKLINAFFLFLFPSVIYFFTFYLFKNKAVGILSSLLLVLSWGVQSMTRQLHEAFLTSFFIVCASYFFILVRDKNRFLDRVFFILSIFLALFSYQSARIFALFFAFLVIFYLIKRKISLSFVFSFLIVFLVFFLTDIVYQPRRVYNLFFLNNPGLSLRINELRGEGGLRIFYNKLTLGLKERVFEYLKYFSPQFLVIEGDQNYRFGYPNFLSIITPVEYIFFFIGLYYLFKNKEKNRYYILGLMFISPVAGCLTWDETSLSRTFFIIIPILIIAAYGVLNFVGNLKNRKIFSVLAFIFLSYIFFLFYNWDFYLNHYPKKAVSIYDWQCGYKELVAYIKNHYHKFNKFYITKEGGPPYIFLLFFLKYPPQKYQKQANTSPIDQYGFSQAEKFDKFIFNLDYKKSEKNIAVIGRPHDFSYDKNIKKIFYLSEPIFFIKEIF